MRFTLILATLAAIFTPLVAAAAEPFATPKALLEYAYAPYATDNFPDDPYELYSKRTRQLFADDAARTPEGEIGALDFDVFINGQDYTITKLEIEDAVPDGDVAMPLVTFMNFDQPQTMLFHLVKEDGGWLIDDIESLTPGFEWRLTALLEAAASS